MSDLSSSDEPSFSEEDSSEFEVDEEPKRSEKPKAKAPANKRKTEGAPPEVSAPKKRKAAPKPMQSKDDGPEAKESKRRKDAALETKIVAGSTSYPASGHPACLSSKALMALDGLDVVKKGGGRTKKHLFVLPFEFRGSSAGALGRLTKMDTQNPIMYLEFETGRMKLLGTIVHPESKLIHIKPKGGQAVCEKVYESLIVFGSCVWVGTLQENPNEDELPIPPEIKQKMREAPQDGGTLNKTARLEELEEPPEENRRTSGRAARKNYTEKNELDVEKQDSNSSSSME